MIIGLTGTYCAGKNYVAAIMKKKGLPVLDVDKLGYKVLENEKETIYAQFCMDLQKADSSWKPEAALDRRLLGQIVFKDPQKLRQLEAIVHPAANRLTEEWITEQSKTGNRACVINAALLHKSSVFERLDRIILVTAPYLTRFLRAHRRDKLPWKEILKRFASQKNFYTQYLSKKAEIYIVENPGFAGFGNVKLESQIDTFIEGIS